MKEIDFGVIAVTHACNSNCEFCVDKFVHKEGKVVSLSDVDKFLRVLKSHVGDKRIGIILLGGEPTMARTKVLVDICNKIHEYGFDAEMSTNGILRGKIAKLIPYFEWVKITAHNDEEIEYWSDFKEKVNLKWAGDESFTLDVYKHFVEMSEGFSRRSIPIYFNPETGEELLTDLRMKKYLDSLTWSEPEAQYIYAFDSNGVRFKRRIPGLVKETPTPTVPRLYPNGNYNITWENEELNDYLTDNEWNKL